MATATCSAPAAPAGTASTAAIPATVTCSPPSADASEQSWLTSTAAGYGTGDDWWIGFNDRSSEGSWAWSSGQSVTSANWSSGQPYNGSGTEDCAWLSPGSGLWNDEQCWDTQYSVYEAH